MSIGDSAELSATDDWGAKEGKRTKGKVEANAGEVRRGVVDAGVRSETTV